MQGKANANKDSNHKNPTGRMGSFGSQSETSWNESLGIDQNAGKRRDHGKTSDDCYQPERDTGKILGQLSELEEAFLAYVHGHQDRLETRLKESKAQEASFLEGAVKLKEDILRMLQEVESAKYKH